MKHSDSTTFFAKLSDVLNTELGKEFSVDTLENARKFYLNYQG